MKACFTVTIDGDKVIAMESPYLPRMGERLEIAGEILTVMRVDHKLDAKGRVEVEVWADSDD